jgi:hypothetical protein
MSVFIFEGFQDYSGLPNRPVITFTTSISTKVTDAAERKARAVRSHSALTVSAKILSKAASEIMKTSRGNRKAATTLDTMEGPLLFPNRL